VPTALVKSKEKIIEATKVADGDQNTRQVRSLQKEKEFNKQTPVIDNPEALQNEIKKLKKEMESAAKALDFIEAARIRDLIKALEKK
jgi:excinuclease ABC subunit B